MSIIERCLVCHFGAQTKPIFFVDNAKVVSKTTKGNPHNFSLAFLKHKKFVNFGELFYNSAFISSHKATLRFLGEIYQPK